MEGKITTDSQANSEEDKKILDKALNRFKISAEAFEQTFENGRIALDFRVLDQWGDSVRSQRENDPDGPRPTMTLDKIGQYVHQICNDFRQQKTGIDVLPVDSEADVEVAEIYKDIIRRIESQSTASQAYSWAFQCALETGLGYWRVITDYEEEGSFTQDIYIKKLANPFGIFFDPNATYTDGRDADYVFVVEDMDKELFKETYGDIVGEFGELSATVMVASDWYSQDRVRIAEYYYKEKVDVEIGLTADGMSIEITEHTPKEALDTMLKKRKTTKTIVKWCKLTSSRILERGIWPSKYLPVVRIVGDEHRVPEEGLFYQGMIFPAIDAQRIYNYAASSFVETVALAPKAPYIAEAGQIENYAKDWAEANNRNIAVLRYDGVDINGTPLPPPQRQPMVGVPQGWGSIQQFMMGDVQQSMGIYQASVGASGNERTGEAIMQRKTQGEHSQFHFFDNASMAIEQTGKIIVDLIPKIYDTPRVMKIRGEDGLIKQAFINPQMMGAVKEKIDSMNRILGKEINPMVGKYDVVIASGPSSATKRQETSKNMMLLAQTNPEIMKIGGDILVKNMDFPGSQELANRIFRTIPSNITNPNPEQSPEMMQMQAQNQQLMQENAMLQSGIAEKMQIQQLNSQTTLQVTQAKEENENTRTLAKIEADKEIVMIQEAGKIKSSRLTSRGEVTEEFVKNIGAHKAILMEKGATPEQADSMLGEFSNFLRTSILKDIGITGEEKDTETSIEKKDEEVKQEADIKQEEDDVFTDDFTGGEA